MNNFYGESGIPFKVLFVFDLRFQEEFENMDGKSGDKHMETAMALVKWAYLDKSLQDNLGTTINIIGTKERLMKRLPLNLTEEQVNEIINIVSPVTIKSIPKNQIIKQQWVPKGLTKICYSFYQNWSVHQADDTYYFTSQKKI